MDDLQLVGAAADLKRFGVARELFQPEFGHVRRDRSAYTALWNLCATPAFLAKTTDGNNHPEVVASLRRRAFELYGHLPADTTEPPMPAGYRDLDWAPHPPPVDDLEAVYRQQMATKSKDRVVVSARELGWLFSGWQPDQTL